MSFALNCMLNWKKNLMLGVSQGAKKRRNRKGRMCDSEIMTIIVLFHFSGYRTFKDFYICCIKGRFKKDFPTAVSYTRFVELMPRVFVPLMLFMRLSAFGKCSGITFVDSTMIPVCHNMRRYFNKVFDGFATDGKGTMGWCHGFKLHLLCNDSGEIISFCLTVANVDDRNPNVWNVFAKDLFGKVFADRGYISQSLFNSLFDKGIHIVHGIKANMKNKLMPMMEKILLRKRYIIETINDLLKNKAQLVHSRHRSIHNFIMNICGALTAYCFFDNKPDALPVHFESSNQLALQF